MGKRIAGVDPGLVETLRGYGFPGNVRELANEIERAVVRVDEGEALSPELLSEDVTARAASPAAGQRKGGLREQLAQVERQIISEALARHCGRKAATAEELGLTRQGLRKKMERLGL
jgi:two-component system response regulator HupR/HoxA